MAHVVMNLYSSGCIYLWPYIVMARVQVVVYGMPAWRGVIFMSWWFRSIHYAVTGRKKGRKKGREPRTAVCSLVHAASTCSIPCVVRCVM